MNLTQQLKERADATAASKSAEDLATLTNSVTEVENAGIVNNALKVGDTAPDFALADAEGNTVRLSELLEKGPVAIAFYRGAWCPYCNLELKALQELLPEFRAAGATLVAISPQTPDESLSTEEKHNLEFPVLSDSELEAINGFGLIHPVDERTKVYYEKAGFDLVKSNGAAGWQLPLPATYVIAPDRRIRFAFVNADYKLRAEPSDVLAAIKAI
ncbi:peroxiredoxin-like family protein [Salinibacterium sp. SWN1162]|uniref:peroxiredoxin-like family protein n=1 Tax=Salinibacterium sp. SWN1162 TaxID=2792053 RepID=UPI0018CEADAB|nr:peroxiredoxin-like family protein [Salinibacterium sp. SWN1162]MBH0008085.1 AhpC/TSA family protein [Salinibacterium sp. SWN1162]